MSKYIIMNKHTLEVYASLEAEDETAAKENWAKKCGCENFVEFEGKLTIPLEDIEFNAVACGNAPNISDKVTFIFEITLGEEWVFFVRFQYFGTVIWEWVTVPVASQRTPRRHIMYPSDKKDLSFLPSNLRRWRDVPPEIQKIVEDIIFL